MQLKWEGLLDACDLNKLTTIYFIINRSTRVTNTDIFINKVCLTLIRESWKKNPKRGTVTERVLRKKIPERSIESFVYVSMLRNFFPEIALGHGPKNWFIFLFKLAYVPSLWHMPFEINITR